jgi:hypothetical protein
MGMDNRLMRPIEAPETVPSPTTPTLTTLSKQTLVTISGFALRTIQNV